MKKILLVLVLLACSVFAGKPVNVEVCRPGFCYTHVLHDVKKAEYRTDVAGNRFVRVYFPVGGVFREKSELFQDFHVPGNIQEPSVEKIHPDKTVPGDIRAVFGLLDVMQYMGITESRAAHLDIYRLPGKH